MTIPGTWITSLDDRSLTARAVGWSLGEDSADYSYIKAMQAGLKTL